MPFDSLNHSYSVMVHNIVGCSLVIHPYLFGAMIRWDQPKLNVDTNLPYALCLEIHISLDLNGWPIHNWEPIQEYKTHLVAMESSYVNVQPNFLARKHCSTLEFLIYLHYAGTEDAMAQVGNRPWCSCRVIWHQECMVIVGQRNYWIDLNGNPSIKFVISLRVWNICCKI